jgi:hypothetical protein
MCYQVVDLGTQEKMFKGVAKKQRQIRIAWELPHELTEEGEPMVIGKRYALSLHKNAHLRADLEAWRAKAYSDDELDKVDLEKLLGAPASLTIVTKDTNGQTITFVDTVAKLMKGTPHPEKTHNPLLCISLDPAGFNKRAYESLTDGMKALIARSPEYQAIASGKPMANQGRQYDPDLDDEIPF